MEINKINTTGAGKIWKQLEIFGLPDDRADSKLLLLTILLVGVGGDSGLDSPLWDGP